MHTGLIIVTVIIVLAISLRKQLSVIDIKIAESLRETMYWKGVLDTWRLMAGACKHRKETMCYYYRRIDHRPGCSFKECPIINKVDDL